MANSGLELADETQAADDAARAAGGGGGGGKTMEEELIEKVEAERKELDRRAALDPSDPDYLSKGKRGPVLSGIRDMKDPTGQVHFGLNDPKQLPPADLHPLLEDRLAVQTEEYQRRVAEIMAKPEAERTAEEMRVLTAGTPGYHSEVYALDSALKAREATSGIAATIEDLKDFLLHNTALKGKQAGIGVPPRCFNCNPLTQGVSLTNPLELMEKLFHGH
jgi:hypothetical protein